MSQSVFTCTIPHCLNHIASSDQYLAADGAHEGSFIVAQVPKGFAGWKISSMRTVGPFKPNFGLSGK